jgi:hypothetical protein
MFLRAAADNLMKIKQEWLNKYSELQLDYKNVRKNARKIPSPQGMVDGQWELQGNEKQE